ncbi:fungal-specific transcription factor domain-containing protein [Aspergillus heterothallicus]
MASGEGKQSCCWECPRRMLVCGSQRQACSRCIDVGTTCPGYTQVPPFRIRWLEPGRVDSRNRSREPKLKNKEDRKRKDKPPPSRNVNPSSSSAISLVPYFDLFDLAGEDLKASKAAVDFLHEVVWPKLAPMKELGIGDSIYRVSPNLFQAAVASPYYIRHGMTCMAIVHQRNRVRHDPVQEKALVATFLQFRGKMIRSLSDDIGMEEKQTADMMVLAGIFQLLFADISQGFSDGWRYHFNAAYKFILSRGNLRSMAEEPSTQILVHTFIYTAVVADSSSPPADQVLAPQDVRHLDMLIRLLDTTTARYTFNTYPAYLFAQIMQINHLRAMATKYGVPPQDLNEQACKILRGLHSFSVEQWVQQSKASCQEDYILLGHTYRSSVLLYCISSLKSVSVLSSTSSLDSMASQETQTLFNLLKQSLKNPRIKMFMVWPLMVLGVEAVHGKIHEKRDFVRRWTENMCTFTGSYSLFHLREVLEKFWASGKTVWDACFDRPYLFTSVTNMNLAKMA